MTYKTRKTLLEENGHFKSIVQRLRVLIENGVLFTDTPEADNELFLINEAIKTLEVK